MQELVAELGPLVSGASVLDLQPVPPRDVLLVLEPRGSALVRRLRLSAGAEGARLHLQIAPVRRHEGSCDPFFSRLGSFLAGAALDTLEQVADDRVVRAAFRRDGAPVGALVLELTGRHANMVWLDPAGRVSACLVPPAADSPGAARLAPGAEYDRPPGRRAVSDPGPSIAEVFPSSPEEEPAAALAPLSARVEAALGGLAGERWLAERRRDLEHRLERRIASAESRFAGLQERERAGEAAERLRMDGELLLAHMKDVPRGAREVELPDSFTPGSPPRRIALDPGLSPRRNAEKLFARYKKHLRAREHLPAELAEARATAEALRAWLARAGDEDPAEVEALAIAAGVLDALPPPREKAKTPAPRRPYQSFVGLRGSEIRVGRNAADNDRLTFRESRGNDLWLHTSGSPGSHVVLRLERNAEPDPEEVLDAAHLALHFSPLRGASRADVHVARRKEVHKPRKAPPGLVTLSGGKTLRLRVEPERLERLLRRGRRGAGSVEGPGSPSAPSG